MSDFFEEELIVKNFVFNLDPNFDPCLHLHGGPDEIKFTTYHQDCSCCNKDYNIRSDGYSENFSKPYLDVISQDLKWFKREGCSACMEDMIDTLGHGGHYDNIRVFKSHDNIVNDVTEEYGFKPYILDSYEKVYEDFDEWVL